MSYFFNLEYTMQVLRIALYFCISKNPFYASSISFTSCNIFQPLVMERTFSAVLMEHVCPTIYSVTELMTVVMVVMKLAVVSTYQPLFYYTLTAYDN